MILWLCALQVVQEKHVAQTDVAAPAEHALQEARVMVVHAFANPIAQVKAVAQTDAAAAVAPAPAEPPATPVPAMPNPPALLATRLPALLLDSRLQVHGIQMAQAALIPVTACPDRLIVQELS